MDDAYQIFGLRQLPRFLGLEIHAVGLPFAVQIGSVKQLARAVTPRLPIAGSELLNCGSVRRYHCGFGGGIRVAHGDRGEDAALSGSFLRRGQRGSMRPGTRGWE